MKHYEIVAQCGCKTGPVYIEHGTDGAVDIGKCPKCKKPFVILMQNEVDEAKK